MVLLLSLVLITAYWVCALIVSASNRSGIGVDETAGVQKFHDAPVPRLGGVGIFVALLTGLLGFAWITHQYKQQAAFLIISLLPAFGMGLVEDLTRRAGELSRLLAAMLSATLGWWLFHAGLFRISWDAADQLLGSSLIAGYLMTIAAAAGSAHSVNIIDGCHGLSGFFVMAALTALAVVAGSVDDIFVCTAAAVTAAAVAGFMIWNFPRGRLFLGDAGAYMLGFMIAQLAMILITRHPEVSPWCAMLIMAYPAWEMLFSMYRRAEGGLRHMGRPDARHLHTLVYRRILKWAPNDAAPDVRNFRSACASMMLWPLILLCTVPAAIFWHKTTVLFLLCWLFAATYTVVYITIVRFKVPGLLVTFINAKKSYFERAPAAEASAEKQLQN